MLLICGKEFEEAESGELDIKGTKLQFPPRKDLDGHHTLQTASTIWDCSIVLAKYMERNEHLIKNKAIIELGCGRGLAGLACRLVTENSVVLTDLAPVIPPLKETIALNKLANIDAKALDWTNRKHGFPKFEVILAADVVWVYDLIEEFVTVLEELSSSTTTIYLAHQSRSNRADERLFNLLENKFLIQKTPREELEFNHSNVINIYQLKMK